MSKFQKDYTQGSVVKQLISFSLPFLFSNLLQALYSVVDMVVVGQYVGPVGVSGVQIGGQVTMLITNIVTGFVVGATVLVAQYQGAKNNDGQKKTISTLFTFFAFVSVGLTVLMILLNAPILRLLGTDDISFNEAYNYLLCCSFGYIFIFGYNAVSGILRGMGDSKRPLWFVAIATVTNIILDLVFVIVFHMGVSGVAYATIISQWISAILVLSILTKETNAYKLVWKDLRIDKATTLSILRIGFPAGLQMAVTSFSNVFVQSYINHFGSSCMAGWTTYGKLDKFCLLPIQSVGLSVTTFVGQNLGAGNMNRAKKVTTTALIIAIGTAIILMFPVLLFASTLTSLFTQDEEVLAFGVRFIRLMMPFYIAICFNQIYANALRGAGNSTAPMVIMMGSFIVFRQIYLFIISKCFDTITSVALGYPFGWILCSVLLFIYYHKVGLHSKQKI